ncbi:MAG: Do family serine endopeptidase [Spirochaetota bacterium]
MSTKRMRRIRRNSLKNIGFAVAVLVGLSMDAFLPGAVAQSSESVSPTGPAELDTPASEEVLWAYQNAFRRAAHEALPVVVKIDVVDIVTQRVPSFQNPFSFFFGPREAEPAVEERELRRPGLGSGVIVRRAGEKVYVLTNDHVAGDADEITVSLHDGRSFEAAVVYTEDSRDLALVVFETSEEVPIAKLGDSDDLVVGDWVFAVGNPLGFESTVTSGIISAVGRRPAAGSRISALVDYIQTDAAINQGNSGGALVNLAGEVVGINTWIASQSGGSVGLGFAIPINNAKRVIDEFVDYGSVEYGWLGIVYGGSVTEDVAASLGVRDARGAFIGSVYEGSPAARAGLRPGDVVYEIDGDRVAEWTDLVNTVGNAMPGQTMSFRFRRDGRTATRRIELGGRRLTDRETPNAEFWPGLVVTPLTDEMRAALGLRAEPGSIVVADVVSSGPAAESGIRRGDIIRRINDQEVDNLADFYEAVNGRANEELVFRVGRQGREFLIGLVR